jgi:hypothetical protein
LARRWKLLERAVVVGLGPRAIDLERSAYRASHIALHSSYQLPTPQIRALTNEWDDPLTLAGNPADI